RGFLRDIEKLTGITLERVESEYSKTYDASQEGKPANPRNFGNTFQKKPRRGGQNPGGHKGKAGQGKPGQNKSRQNQRPNRRGNPKAA
ncbi:MAG: hypothetical protein COA85_07045, partial [Robiginitomaculum sp.]